MLPAGQTTFRNGLIFLGPGGSAPSLWKELEFHRRVYVSLVKPRYTWLVSFVCVLYIYVCEFLPVHILYKFGIHVLTQSPSMWWSEKLQIDDFSKSEVFGWTIKADWTFIRLQKPQGAVNGQLLVSETVSELPPAVLSGERIHRPYKKV